MRKVINNYSNKRQGGRSIVELMVAVTIGMAILIAISSLFLANKKTFRSVDDKSRLDEEGRLALNLMAYHIRMAGYGTLISSIERADSTSGPQVSTTAATYTTFSDSNGASVDAIRGCTGGFTDSAVTLASISCTGTSTAPDSFLVRYVVDQYSGNTTGAAAPTDCLGAAVLATTVASDPDRKKAGATQQYIVENRFYVRTTNGVPELYCQGNGGLTNPTSNLLPGQPIAENVETMKLTYGLNFTQGKQTIDRYLRADQMTAADWQKVIAVKVCLVVRSATDNVATASQSYIGCDGTTTVTPSDKRLRSVFTTTVTIRSRAVGAA